MKFLRKLFESLNRFFAAIPSWLISLAVRLVMFRVFWLSAQTKITGWTVFDQHFAFWNLTDNVYFQFWDYPPPLDSTFMIFLGTFAEFFFSIFILLGLFTRYAAIGLIGVTLVIQFVEPNGWWSAHVYWVLLLILLVRQGGGLVSLDQLLFKRT